jgi:subtilisin-like proprotein convertase family protein
MNPCRKHRLGIIGPCIRDPGWAQAADFKLRYGAKIMKRTTLMIAVVLLALARPAQADFVQVFNGGFQNGGVIPGGSLTGWSDTRNLVGAPAGIKDVSVTLNLSGGWNGDLYAYLVHSCGFAVLLNRVGVGAGNSSGYGTSGMSVTLNDAAVLGNIHNVSTPAPEGIYRPDGRNISPLSSGAVFDGATPTALLSSFQGLNANGNWKLFIADVSGGDVSTVTSWGLDIAAVPEPGSLIEGAVAVLFLGGVVGLYRLSGRKTPLQPCRL